VLDRDVVRALRVTADEHEPDTRGLATNSVLSAHEHNRAEAATCRERGAFNDGGRRVVAPHRVDRNGLEPRLDCRG
jgi:hypothetical protein